MTFTPERWTPPPKDTRLSGMAAGMLRDARWKGCLTLVDFTVEGDLIVRYDGVLRSVEPRNGRITDHEVNKLFNECSRAAAEAQI